MPVEAYIPNYPLVFPYRPYSVKLNNLQANKKLSIPLLGYSEKMKIISKKLKENKIKLQVDSLDDLWHISNLISKGDVVYAKTFRTVELKDADKKQEKKPVRLKLKVEKLNFDKTINRLKILGVIISGTPEEHISFGAHHSLNLELGSELTIEKDWKAFELKMIKDAQMARPKVVIASIDKGQADIGLLKDYGIEYSSLKANIPGKDSESKEIHDAETRFFHEIAKALARYKFQKCILCGAGFWKDNLMDLLKEKYKDIAKNTLVENTGSYGRNAISELLKRGAIEKLVQESKISEETVLVNRFLEELGKDGLCVYGEKNTRKANEYRAIETLIITDILIREKRNTMDPLLKSVERNKGKICIVSTEHEAGKQVDSLGGIVAILRFRIE